jgi:hypothetical protein
VYSRSVLVLRSEISVWSLVLDSAARSWDFVMFIIVLSISWSAERFISSVFLSASTLIFWMLANFSRTSFAPLFAFSSILLSFSLNSLSDVPPMGVHRLAPHLCGCVISLMAHQSICAVIRFSLQLERLWLNLQMQIVCGDFRLRLCEHSFCG